MRNMIAAAALLLSAPFAANAATIDGVHYNTTTNPQNIAGARAIIANAVAPTATFEAMALEFTNQSAGNTLDTWLGTNGTVTGGTAEAVASAVFVFSGLVSLQAGINTFGVQSDDGFELLIDGNRVADFDKNRGFNQTPTTGDFDAGNGGVFAFELLFWDGPGGATGLRTPLKGNVLGMNAVVGTAPVPLPAGLPLLAAGLGGLAVLRRRTRS